MWNVCCRMDKALTRMPLDGAFNSCYISIAKLLPYIPYKGWHGSFFLQIYYRRSKSNQLQQCQKSTVCPKLQLYYCIYGQALPQIASIPVQSLIYLLPLPESAMEQEPLQAATSAAVHCSIMLLCWVRSVRSCSVWVCTVLQQWCAIWVYTVGRAIWVYTVMCKMGV